MYVKDFIILLNKVREEFTPNDIPIYINGNELVTASDEFKIQSRTHSYVIHLNTGTVTQSCRCCHHSKTEVLINKEQ